jgi:protoheme IX farnesyltransferase
MMRDYAALLKLGKIYRVVLSAGLGVAAALPIPPAQWRQVIAALAGGLVAAAAANVLNMYFDRDADAGCTTTMTRPLACGRIAPRQALGLACILGGIAAAILILFGSPAVDAAVAAAVLCYIVVYTRWLKRCSVGYTLVGGAIWSAPIPILWWAAGKPASALPMWLFVLTALWVALHTWLAGLLRPEDYRAPGVRFLPVVYGPAATRRVIVWVTLAMAAVAVASGRMSLELLSGILAAAAILSWVNANRRLDIFLHRVAVGYVAVFTLLIVWDAVVRGSPA